METATYVGSVVRAGVRIDGGVSTLLRLEVAAGRGPVAGERVGIAVDPDDVNLFPTEQGG